MKEQILLNAVKRDCLGKKVAEVRSKGFVPAVMYGYDSGSVPLSVPLNVFEKLYAKAGESTLVDLTIDSRAPIKVLVHDVQRDPLSDKPIHIDFYKVNMKEKLHATIPLKFIGESRAVKELGGTLVKSISEVDVRCFPDDLVHEIEVDISSLVDFEALIYIRSISLPKNIEVLGDGETVVAVVTQPLSEAQLKALEEKPVENVESVKVEEKGKKEEEKEGE